MQSVLLIGSSGHAKVIFDAITRSHQYQVEGFLDDFLPRGQVILDRPILGKIDEILTVGITRGILAIGDNWARFQIMERIQKIMPAFEFIQVIHPSAVVATDVTIGPGTVILAGAIINSGSTIGSHVIVNTRATVEHDNVLADFSSVGPGATLGGYVRLGSHSSIGIGSCVRQKTTIDENVVIGAGAVVISNIEHGVVAYGVPAKPIRSRKRDEAYL
jgi:sugar O-acyltransferase (sialic acid O-acetyltransferase NeuD family)